MLLRRILHILIGVAVRIIGEGSSRLHQAGRTRHLSVIYSHTEERATILDQRGALWIRNNAARSELTSAALQHAAEDIVGESRESARVLKHADAIQSTWPLGRTGTVHADALVLLVNLLARIDIIREYLTVAAAPLIAP